MEVFIVLLSVFRRQSENRYGARLDVGKEYGQCFTATSIRCHREPDRPFKNQKMNIKQRHNRLLSRKQQIQSVEVIVGGRGRPGLKSKVERFLS